MTEAIQQKCESDLVSCCHCRCSCSACRASDAMRARRTRGRDVTPDVPQALKPTQSAPKASYDPRAFIVAYFCRLDCPFRR